MTIQVETLKYACGLALAASAEANATRRYKIRVNPHGIVVQCTAANKGPKFLHYEQTIPWRDIESPIAKIVLETTFRRIEDAVARELESANAKPTSAR